MVDQKDVSEELTEQTNKALAQQTAAEAELKRRSDELTELMK